MGKEDAIYSSAEVKALLRNYLALRKESPLSSYLMDVQKAVSWLDIQDRYVFRWMIEGQTHTYIGTQLEPDREGKAKPMHIGRYAVERLVRNLVHRLNNPWRINYDRRAE